MPRGIKEARCNSQLRVSTGQLRQDLNGSRYFTNSEPNPGLNIVIYATEQSRSSPYLHPNDVVTGSTGTSSKESGCKIKNAEMYKDTQIHTSTLHMLLLPHVRWALCPCEEWAA